jgi:hypothetical protein
MRVYRHRLRIERRKAGIALSCFAAFWNALEVIEVVEQDQENV